MKTASPTKKDPVEFYENEFRLSGYLDNNFYKLSQISKKERMIQDRIWELVGLVMVIQ